MRTVRDLRDLVNVSRLSFKDSDDEESSFDFDLSKTPVSSSISYKFDPNKVIINDQQKVGIKSKPPLINLSKTTPIKTLSNTTIIKNNSMSASRDLLLDRNSVPSVSFSLSHHKKPLPPLTFKTENNEESPSKEETINNNKNIMNNIEPLKMKQTNNNIQIQADDSNKETGNFDEMLTYIDASVVSEWLNRANRSLRKMHKWHQDNTDLFSNNLNSSKLLKYEPFILFTNFWLGSHPTAKFDHKQRRQLIEMEHSIISEEVTQAFQVGIDSQQIGIGDIHRLLRAVLKEYPLQFLSFRGVYMLLDYIEILSSNRQEDYKKLLSDVKCRTLNKQYAQWLLSIRSFSLINLCWSIIKFYRKTVENEINFNNNNKNSTLADLDGRLSSLSLSNREATNISGSHSSLSNSSSSNSSTSTISSSASSSHKQMKQRIKSAKKKSDEEFITVSNQIKYDLYLDSVYKHDLPEVLHYLILTKKYDPFKKDNQGRTLVFLAVMNNKPKILNYLIKRWPSIDVNEACNSGNTPLHAAVNKANLELVDILLQSLNNEIEIDETNSNEASSVFHKKVYKLDIDKKNEKCMDSTALHLAVWNDFNEIAIRLVRAGADPNLKMNKTSNAFELALENSNQILYELLKEYSSLVVVTR